MNYLKMLYAMWKSMTPEQQEAMKDGFLEVYNWVKERLIEKNEYTAEEMVEIDRVVESDPALIGGFGAPPVPEVPEPDPTPTPTPPVVEPTPDPPVTPDPVPPPVVDPPVVPTAQYDLLLTYNPMQEVQRAKGEGYVTGDHVFYLDRFKMHMVRQTERIAGMGEFTYLGRLP